MPRRRRRAPTSTPSPTDWPPLDSAGQPPSEIVVLTELLGKAMLNVRRVGEELHFITERGGHYRLFHRQDCCESVHIEDICGDLNDLLDAPLLQAEQVTGGGGTRGVADGAAVMPGPPNADSWTWTFYKFATVRGAVTVRFLGTSNGYYSEAVSFQDVAAVTRAREAEARRPPPAPRRRRNATEIPAAGLGTTGVTGPLPWPGSSGATMSESLSDADLQRFQERITRQERRAMEQAIYQQRPQEITPAPPFAGLQSILRPDGPGGLVFRDQDQQAQFDRMIREAFGRGPSPGASVGDA